jgi:hypothetical protein
MTLRQVGVRFLLIAALLAPPIFVGAKAWDSAQDVNFAKAKLETIREASGLAVHDVKLAKERASALATIGIKSWGIGQAQDRITAAFLETDLIVEPDAGFVNGPISNNVPSLVGFERIVVRARGSVRAAKEALWNLGDLGPGLRIDSFKGEFEPAANTIVWTYVILATKAPQPVVPAQRSTSVQP